MSIVQWPHAVSTQRGKCVCLCNILILPTWIRVSITLMLAQYVITKMLWRWNINIMDYEINKMSYLWLLLSLCIEVQNEKCIWKIFVKYTQIRQSNTNTNTNISSCGFQIQIQMQIQIFAYLNTNTNTNTYLTPALAGGNQSQIGKSIWPWHILKSLWGYDWEHSHWLFLNMLD